VLFVNLTSRQVEQVTVGLMLEDKTSPEPVTRLGKVCNTSVPPGRFLLVKTANTGLDGADAYFRGKGITQEAVAVGITQVRLAGGPSGTSRWKPKAASKERGTRTLKERSRRCSGRRSAATTRPFSSIRRRNEKSAPAGSRGKRRCPRKRA